MKKEISNCIRLGQEADLEKIYEIEKEDVDAWSYEILRQDLLENEFSTYFVYEEEGQILGFISTMNICGEIHINNISVRSDFRNKKIGTRLLKEGINYYKDQDIIGYTLEVRMDNEPAINLYKKTGFEIAGTRKNYYKNNKDAIIMWRLA